MSLVFSLKMTIKIFSHKIPIKAFKNLNKGARSTKKKTKIHHFKSE